MKKLQILAAALTWVVVLAAILVVTGFHGTVAGALGTWTVALVAALAVALTLGLAVSPLPLIASYVAVHLAGALVVAVIEGTRPPWAWRALPRLVALLVHDAASAHRTVLVLLTLGLTWELSYACTWLVVRDRRVWLALGLIVGTLTLRGPRPLQGRDAYLAALCVTGLALVLVSARLEWRRRASRRLRAGLGVRLAPLLLLPLAGGLVAGAWAAPLPSAGAVAVLRATHWTAALGYLLTRAGFSSGQAGDSAGGLLSFGSSLRVGGRFQPDGTPVLDARVADPALSPYWRGAVYDRYANGVWHAMPAHTVREGARAQLPMPSGIAVVAPITQVISLLRPSTALFTAGLPWRVDVPSVAVLASKGMEAGVLGLGPVHGTLNGPYAALSLPAPTAPTLPAPALSRALRALDLGLPPLPARVRSLARRLVAGAPDPFSRAWAIQAYLRGPGGGYSYDTAPPRTPAGQDPVSYFLFSSRRGFCTHFATAMVVLARLAGIPARLVTGFAAGHLVDGRFLVTTADAHAWPELWIAGRGWVTFEPTPNFPTPFQAGALPPGKAHPAPAATATPSARAGAAPTPAAQLTATPRAHHGPVSPAYGSGPGGSWAHLHPRLPPSALPGALAALLLCCAALLVLRARPGADALYGRMCYLAGRLRVPPRSGQTPLEWAAQVAARAPEDGAAVVALTTLYVRQRYGGHRPEPAELAAARGAWRQLRRRWILRLLARRPL